MPEEVPASKKTIASRGVPSSESIFFPTYNGPETKKFQDSNETPTRNIWSMEDIVNFVFPKKYQEKYHEIAILFLALVASKPQISGVDISSFINKNKISKATFYNRVLPRLRRVGMIKIERETIIPVESKRKFRPMKITLSKTFGNYMMKIGDSWLAAVDDARSKQ